MPFFIYHIGKNPKFDDIVYWQGLRIIGTHVSWPEEIQNSTVPRKGNLRVYIKFYQAVSLLGIYPIDILEFMWNV